jgi:hypothetical protein
VTVIITPMQAEVAVVPAILGAEVDHYIIILVPAEVGEGLPTGLVQARALLLEVMQMPGIKPTLTTPAVPVRGVREDLIIVMELVAMLDGS